MLAGAVSKLNSTVYSFLGGVAVRQQGRVWKRNLVLAGQGKLLGGDSARSYSVRLLSSTNQFSLGRSCSRKLMAVSSSNAALGDVYIDELHPNRGNPVRLAKPTSVFFNDRSHGSCLKASLRLRNQEPFGCLKCGLVRPWSKNHHPMSSICYSTRAAQDVSFDGNSRDEQIESSATLSDHRTLKLSSGSCYLPHPAKEATGGEDAHFILEDEQTIGVADGVGGWADVGVNAGLFSRELMSNAVAAIQDEPKGSIDPARVLEKAHSGTKAKGSSTAVIITLTDKGLHAINLGDSGFIVVRDGHTIFQSPVQVHGFNFTYQLESGSGADLPSSGEVFTIPVSKGDVIVAGTDGLFDNLYNNEVTAVVVHAMRAGFEPRVTAQKIAALARQRALDKTRQTPFSTAAQEAGYRYYGGKLDDITVVVSYVTSSANV